MQKEQSGIPVYITICKSTSKNVRNKMSYYTYYLSLKRLGTTTLNGGQG
jgi:hypothetical protein